MNVGTKIQNAAGRGGEAWEFVVFDTDEKNAFVLPGGRVGCYRGLMQFCDNDSQLAAVLGHETGHVTAHHAAERASQSTLASTILGAAGGGDLGAVGVQYLLLMPNGRLQESEADRLGVDYMYRAGYDVREAVRLWEKMAAAGGSRSPEFLSTHPSPATRIADIQNYIIAKGLREDIATAAFADASGLIVIKARAGKARQALAMSDASLPALAAFAVMALYWRLCRTGQLRSRRRHAVDARNGQTGPRRDTAIHRGHPLQQRMVADRGRADDVLCLSVSVPHAG